MTGHTEGAPLLVLPEDRAARELHGALAAGQACHHARIHKRRLLAAGAVEFIAGWALIAFGFHVHGAHLGHAFFLAGTTVAYLAPVWTWLLATWHGGEGP